MNCLHVQDAIWCGELTPGMLQHISSCPKCQREQRRVNELHLSLENVQVPSLSRTLLPSTRDIERTLRTRRRQRLTQWTVGSFSAAACVTLVVLLVPHRLPTTLSEGPNQPAAIQPQPVQTQTAPAPTVPQSSGNNQGGGGDPTPSPVQSTGNWYRVHTKSYSLKLPASMPSTTNQYGWITFYKQGIAVGDLEVESVMNHAPGDYFNAVYLPNHTDVIGKRQLDSGKPNLYIVQFDFKYTPPAADPNGPTTTGTRTYFIDDTNHNVYDLRFPDGAIDADTLQGIIQSFTLNN